MSFITDIDTVTLDELHVSTGFFVKEGLNAYFTNMPSGTKMVFYENTSPDGWYRDFTGQYNNAAIIVTTGAISSGGSTEADQAHLHNTAHTHTLSGHSHTWTKPAHIHLIEAANIALTATSAIRLTPSEGFTGAAVWNDDGVSPANTSPEGPSTDLTTPSSSGTTTVKTTKVGVFVRN